MTRFAALALTLLVASGASALTVEGKSYAPTTTIEGQTLKLVGAGLRQKWFVDVYVLAAYSASGAVDPATLVDADEPKYLRIDMLRNVSAEKMASTIGGSFEEHMPKNPSPELKAQRAAFQNYFKDECTKGSVLEFIYVPGTGTILKQNGKQLGAPLAGKSFARVLWDIYFGTDTCCESLKKGVLKGPQGQ